MPVEIRRAARFAGALALALSTASAAAAGGAGGGHGGALRQACAADVKTLCSNVQPGGGRLKQCLREHADQVSSGCKTAVKEARAAKAAAQNKPAAS